MVKPGLSLERHREIGLELACIRDTLTHLSVEIGNAYPRTGLKGRFSKGLSRAVRVLDIARSDGENIMFVEHGDFAGDIHIYYPSSEDRR